VLRGALVVLERPSFHRVVSPQRCPCVHPAFEMRQTRSVRRLGSSPASKSRCKSARTVCVHSRSLTNLHQRPRAQLRRRCGVHCPSPATRGTCSYAETLTQRFMSLCCPAGPAPHSCMQMGLRKGAARCEVSCTTHEARESGCVLVSLCKASAGLLWHDVGDALTVCVGFMNMRVTRYIEHAYCAPWRCARCTVGSSVMHKG
jgi:hypothetical protein